jgi:phosphatidate cytidylyltransferase
MPLPETLVLPVILRLEVAFALIAVLVALLCVVQRPSAEARREYWLKLGIYYLVVHAFLILLWLGGWWIRLGLAVIALAVCRELLAALGPQGRRIPYELVAYAATAALVLSASGGEGAIGIFFATLLALLSLPVLRQETAQAHARIAAALLATSVAGGLTSVLLRLREAHPAAAVFLYVIVVLGDAFTQLAGQSFGRIPWFQAISPRKTLEGALGGLVACIVGAATFRILLQAPLAWVVALGALIAFSGNLGDLAFSALKRSTGRKDFGTLLPAHGGAVDRFDSLLFSGPVFAAAVRYLRL